MSTDTQPIRDQAEIARALVQRTPAAAVDAIAVALHRVADALESIDERAEVSEDALAELAQAEARS